MDELKNVWLRQDAVGRTVMVTGMLAAVTFLCLGCGLVAVLLMGAMAVICCVYAGLRYRCLYRSYGRLFYRLPDGEEVSLPLSQLEKRHLGREFLLRCPYDGVNADGDWDIGFGLTLDVSGCDALPQLRRGEMMQVQGILAQDDGGYYLAVHGCIRL